LEQQIFGGPISISVSWERIFVGLYRIYDLLTNAIFCCFDIYNSHLPSPSPAASTSTTTTYLGHLPLHPDLLTKAIYCCISVCCFSISYLRPSYKRHLLLHLRLLFLHVVLLLLHLFLGLLLLKLHRQLHRLLLQSGLLLRGLLLEGLV
jgi:hypothetical protein